MTATTPPSRLVDEATLYGASDGTVIYKPDLNGWTLFLRDEGHWRIIDAYDRDQRGRTYSPSAVGLLSPGYVVHEPPAIGYYVAPVVASAPSGQPS